MIPLLRFGRTGHESSRVIFGAAALWNASQEEADRALELLLRHGVNHIDVAASYGEAELRVGPWMERHRERFFLATKTGARDRAGAAAEIRRSLERLRVDHLDLIQLHNLVKEEEWAQALGPDGALQACVDARAEGLVRWIGVTGHGTRVARMHRRSLERFDFDSVLLPYSFPMVQSEAYAAELEALLALCAERDVAVQTIKAVARRRWPEGASPTHGTWYEPLTDPADIAVAVRWALARPGIFVNSAGDLRLLAPTLEAASATDAVPAEGDMARVRDVRHMEPLFVRGYTAGA